jgi:Ca2+/Na+ antiporter
MRKIKSVGVVSVGKIFGAVNAIFGLVAGCIFTIVTFFLSVTTSQTSFVGMIFGVGAIIFLPIFYGVLGFIFGALFALIYNLVAKWFGGIEINLE